jgi:hypothetical protein
MTVAALLQPDGEVIACVAGGDGTPSSPSSHNGGGNGAGTGAGKLSDELIATILTFRKTAASFGATLQHQESPVIHVRGKATLFSCYDIDKHVRSVYTCILFKCSPRSHFQRIFFWCFARVSVAHVSSLLFLSVCYFCPMPRS